MSTSNNCAARTAENLCARTRTPCVLIERITAAKTKQEPWTVCDGCTIHGKYPWCTPNGC